MAVKPIYRFDDMETYFNQKGITYSCSKADLVKFLSETNYFYKLISYRHNFIKNSKNKYIGLSFEMLSDMATIDMHLRYLLLKMCLDIEHRLKTLILSEITNDASEDGYSIVDAFISTSNDPTKTKKQLLDSAKYSLYNNSLYEKYKSHPPVWVVFETMTFGTFIDFVKYYIQRNKSTRYAYLQDLLYSVRNIRNIAAHSSSLLNGVTGTHQTAHSNIVTRYVFKYVGKTTARKKLSNIRVYDLSTLYIVYDNLIPNGKMKRHRKREIIEFLRRAKRNEALYKSHTQISSVYTYFYKLML